MNRPPAVVSAFTLIELMLSIALGSMVIYTAFAGFRVAAQSITVANRLSLENSLMRSGYFEAQRQVDFWTQYDDPDQPVSNRHQTGLAYQQSAYQSPTYRGNDLKGLPFTPMKEFAKSINPPWRTYSIWPVTTSVPKPKPSSTFPPVNSSNTAIINEITPINVSLQSAAAAAALSTLPKDSYWEQDMGWDATYAWAPHDPRTWNRANLRDKTSQGQGQFYQDPANPTVFPADPNAVVEWGYKDDMANAMPPQWYGRYQIFSQCSENSTTDIERNIGVLPYNIIADPNIYSPLNLNYVPTLPESQYFPVNYDNYPREGVRTWFPRQMSALFGAMGYASIIEYLPSGSFYTIYTNSVGTGGGRNGIAWKSRAPLSLGSPPLGGLDILGYSAGNDGWFANNQAQYNYSRSAYSNTYVYSLGFINPRAPIWNPWRPAPSGGLYQGNLPALIGDHFSHYDTSGDTINVTATNSSQAAQSRILLDNSGYREPLMTAQPATWPIVTVAVARYIKNVHHIALSKVSVVSPLTGNAVELSWGALGTSLRGARQQRNQNLTSGWARWDNAAGSVNDKHLDLP